MNIRNHRLKQQVSFIVEVDKLKSVLRQSYIADASRHENSAEHCWHLATMALILAEYSPVPLDVLHVTKMLLIHDIVEVDAGDTSVYNIEAVENQSESELLAANRIFSLLPTDQFEELRQIWIEFENAKTPEAKFAKVLDRLMPLLHNYLTQGRRWREGGIVYEQVMAINKPIREGSPELWQFAMSIIEECVARGYLHKGIKSTRKSA